MSDLPKRTKQHKIDSEGVTLLQYLLPEWYIFRKIDERDYGIDALIELVLDENVMGQFVSLQIKSKKKVKWSTDNRFKMNIQKSTVNYWFNINMPVILVLADTENKEVYFIDVKRYVRKKYDKFVDESKSFSFNFCKILNISTQEASLAMLYAIAGELDRWKFESTFMSLVYSYDIFKEHLSIYELDFFLTVDYNFFHLTKRICNILYYLGKRLYLDLEEIDFESIRKQSREIYEEYYHSKYYEPIQWEITEVHLGLQIWFEKVVKSLKDVGVKSPQYSTLKTSHKISTSL